MRRASFVIAFAVALSVVLALAAQASAEPIIDQQQPIVDTGPNIEWIIGGIPSGDNQLAQVVTPGLTGVLTEVRLAATCYGTTLTVEIQGVTSGLPNGIVLGSQTAPFTFPWPHTDFQGIVFATPVPVQAGVPYAFVLRTSPSYCLIWPGPFPDSYPGGNAYFKSSYNPPWFPWMLLSYQGGRNDLPFQTLVETRGADDMLAELGDAVEGVGPGKSLADKVTAAEDALARNDVPGTCSTMNAFRNQLRAQTGKSVSPSTATSLLTLTTEIETTLGC